MGWFNEPGHSSAAVRGLTERIAEASGQVRLALRQTPTGVSVSPRRPHQHHQAAEPVIAIDPDVQNAVYAYFYQMFEAAVQASIPRWLVHRGQLGMDHDVDIPFSG